MERNRGFLLIVIYFGLAVYLLPMFPHGGSPEELTRWATAASIIEKGSFDTAWTQSLLGDLDGTARVGNRIYSADAPAAAVLSAPFYALTRIFVGAPDASNLRVSWFAMRSAIATLPLVLLAVWLYRRDADEFALFALLFAAPLFLYGLLFFSHILAAALVYFAFRILYDEKNVYPTKCFWGGLVGGAAVLSQYAAVFAVAVFVAGLFFTEKRFRARRLFWFAAGALPLAFLLTVYNTSLFGSPLPTVFAPPHAAAAFEPSALGFPRPGNIFRLLFSPSRGLFFFAPILLLSVVAFFISYERGTLRHNIKICACVVSILFLSGYETAGARHLIFIVPLLLDSVFDGDTDEFPVFWRGFLLTISFLLGAIPALTFPFATAAESVFPHNDFWRPLLIEEQWFAPNLANVFGLPNTVWTILPAAALLLIALGIVWRSAVKPKTFLAGIAAAFAAVGVYAFLPNLDDADGLRFARSVIAERHFKPAARLENFKETAAAKQNWPELRKINALEWEIAAARSFAPGDFPYLETRRLPAAPEAELKRAADLRAQGKSSEAEAILESGKQNFPFARCEFAAALASIYDETERKDAAVAELESVQALVNPASRPECLRAQFMLGALYRRTNRTAEAEQILRRFLENSQNSGYDDAIKDLRQRIEAR